MTRANRPTELAAVALAALLLVGCATPLQASVPAPHAIPDRSKGYIYLGNSRGSESALTVYRLQGSKPLRVVPRTWGVRAMAVDPFGDVYASNGLPSGGEITVYNPGGGSVRLTIDTGAVFAIAFDANGDAYVSDNGFITEYAPHSSNRIRSLGRHTVNVDALAVGASGDIYAAESANNSSGVGRGAIKVFAPKKVRAFREIRHGIATPVALAFDASGNLYVANCASCYAGNGTGSVAEYAPGSDVPFRILKDGIDDPAAIVVGKNGALFVANDPSLSYGPPKPGWISVYSSTGKSPTHKIAKGAKAVNSLAIDRDGYVYAESSQVQGDIIVLSPDGSQVVRTITDGVDTASQIAVGF